MVSNLKQVPANTNVFTVNDASGVEEEKRRTMTTLDVSSFTVTQSMSKSDTKTVSENNPAVNTGSTGQKLSSKDWVGASQEVRLNKADKTTVEDRSPASSSAALAHSATPSRRHAYKTNQFDQGFTKTDTVSSYRTVNIIAPTRSYMFPFSLNQKVGPGNFASYGILTSETSVKMNSSGVTTTSSYWQLLVDTSRRGNGQIISSLATVTGAEMLWTRDNNKTQDSYFTDFSEGLNSSSELNSSKVELASVITTLSADSLFVFPLLAPPTLIKNVTNIMLSITQKGIGIFAFLTNGISLIIFVMLYRKKERILAVFIGISIVDTFALTNQFDSMLTLTVNFTVTHYNAGCKLISWIGPSSQVCSSYFVLLYTVERFVCVRWPMKLKMLFTKRKILQAILTVVFVSFGSQSFYLVMNQTNVRKICGFVYKYVDVLTYLNISLNTFLGQIIPYVAIAVLNSIIIYTISVEKIKRSHLVSGTKKQTAKAATQNSRTTLLVGASTFSLLVSFPKYISWILTLLEQNNTVFQIWAESIVGPWNYCGSFFFYILAGEKFRQQLFILLTFGHYGGKKQNMIVVKIIYIYIYHDHHHHHHHHHHYHHDHHHHHYHPWPPSPAEGDNIRQ